MLTTALTPARPVIEHDLREAVARQRRLATRKLADEAAAQEVAGLEAALKARQ